MLGSLRSLAHRDLIQCQIASVREREGICGRWWLRDGMCLMKLMAKVDKEFSA